MKKEKRFNVVIKDMKGKIVSTIGKDMDEKRAEKRLETGLFRINSDYFVDMVEIKAQELQPRGKR